MRCDIVSDVKLGELGYCSNRPLEANPHPIGTLRWSSWRYGWLKASRVEEPELAVPQ